MNINSVGIEATAAHIYDYDAVYIINIYLNTSFIIKITLFHSLMNSIINIFIYHLDL